MRRVFSNPHIAHQVAVRKSCKAAVNQAGESPLVIPPGNGYSLLIGPLPDGAPILALEHFLKN